MTAWSQFPARNHRDREGLGSSLSALGRRTVTGSASQAKVVARPTEEQLRQRPRPPQCGVARARGAVCAAVPACSHGCPAAGMHGAGGEGQPPGARHSGLLLPRQDGATPTVGNSREGPRGRPLATAGFSPTLSRGMLDLSPFPLLHGGQVTEPQGLPPAPTPRRLII